MGVSEKSAVRNPGWIGLLYGNILGINIQLLDKPGNHIVGYSTYAIQIPCPVVVLSVIINMLTPKPSQTTINDYKHLESSTIWGISDLRTGHFNRLIKAVFTANAICIGSDGGTTEVIILGAMSLVTLPPGLKREWMNMNEHEWIWFIPTLPCKKRDSSFYSNLDVYQGSECSGWESCRLAALDLPMPSWLQHDVCGQWRCRLCPTGELIGHLVGQPKWFDLSWFCAAKLVSCQNL